MLNLYYIRTPSSGDPFPVLARNPDHAMCILEGMDLGDTPHSVQNELLFQKRFTVEEILEWSQIEQKEEWWICFSDAGWFQTTIGDFLFIKTGKAGPHDDI